MTTTNNQEKRNREHLLRWITSLVLAPVLIVVIGFGNQLSLFLLVVVATAVGEWELDGILFGQTSSRMTPSIFIFLSCLIPLFGYLDGIRGLLLGFLFCVTVAFLEAVVTFRSSTNDLERLSLRIFFFLYVAFLLSHILLLPRKWIFFALAVIFAGDCGAYYIGKNFGSRKLSPKVSPGKTVEGAIGGFSASLVVALCFALAVPLGERLSTVLGLGAILNVAGQLGDLAESLIKRSRGIKDSSHILPGHGGLLDRLDSLLLAFPTLYYLIIF